MNDERISRNESIEVDSRPRARLASMLGAGLGWRSWWCWHIRARLGACWFRCGVRVRGMVVLLARR